jgi:hypothetical protein
MFLLDDILFFPGSALGFVLNKIHEAAQEELRARPEALRTELALLYQELEAGRITEQEFDEREKPLLDLLDALTGEDEGEGEPATEGDADE